MINFYEIDDAYIDYLHGFDSHVLSPKKENRTFTRKYVGIMVHIKNVQYFIPLTSYKSIYNNMHESISLKKISNMAVLRINNMIPANMDTVRKISFNDINDEAYKNLCLSEYRILKAREREIRKDSRIVYFYRLNSCNKNKPLYSVCCDFKLLEEKMNLYDPK